MILAAGLGTRLRPLTDHRPKALVEVEGQTLLQITLARLRAFGIVDVIINTHYFAEMISEYLQSNRNFGMNLEISREQELLDTGGGLKQAAQFFLHSSPKLDEPFVLHNVDVLSSIDFGSMLRFHQQKGALATLAMQRRESSRYLLFGGKGELCGRRFVKDPAPEMVRDCPHPEALAFCGVHMISPRLLGMMTEKGVFSIITTYLRLAHTGENIQRFPADQYYWRDLGKPADVAQASEDLQKNLVKI
jgi:NDP-sugar pyrophosphorylase family protein